MNRRGFTLIEIAVVLAIIGMVMLLVLPRLPSSDQENLKISARTLASTLRYMQDRAATGQNRLLSASGAGNGQCQGVRSRRRTAEERSRPIRSCRKRPVKEGILVADVVIPRLGKVSDGQLRLDVGMGGLRDFVIIHLRSPAGEFWTVMAFPAGGKVKVYEGYQEEPL